MILKLILILFYVEKAKIKDIRKCNVCKQDKLLDQFENNRYKCKSCKALMTKKRNNKDLDVRIKDIEALKEDFPRLEAYVKNIPKDQLVIIISHFNIGRKSTDSKAIMNNNVVSYFKRIANPYLCSGGCGYILKEQNTMCNGCSEKKKKKQKTSNEDLADFETNITDYVLNMSEITDDIEYKYTKRHICLIANHLGIKYKNTTNKAELIGLVNKKLKIRQIQAEKVKNNVVAVQEFRHEIVLNDITIQSRRGWND